MRLSRNAPLIITKLLFYDTLPACRAERVQGVQDAHLCSVPHPVKALLHGLTDHWGHDTPSRAGEARAAAISPLPPPGKEYDEPIADVGDQSSHCLALQRRRRRPWRMLR